MRERRLTPRELIVIRMLAEGSTYEQISKKLGRKVDIVTNIIHGAKIRWGMSTTIALVVEAVRNGTISDEPMEPEPIPGEKEHDLVEAAGITLLRVPEMRNDRRIKMRDRRRHRRRVEDQPSDLTL